MCIRDRNSTANLILFNDSDLTPPYDSSTILDLTAMASNPDYFIRQFRWHFAGAEFSGEILGLNVYGEGGYAWIKAKGDSGTLSNAAKSHERILVGMDYTFGFQLYVMAEYLRLGQGAADESELGLNERMAYMAGEVIAVTRDTIFTGLSYPLSDLIDISLYGIIGISDKSAIINPWLAYNLLPGCNLSFTVYVPVGSEQSQMGKSGVSGFFRLKYSF